MKIKRIKKLRVNSYVFDVVWDKDKNSTSWGGFSYKERELTINVHDQIDGEILATICHELMELCAVEMNVSYQRPDCKGDYIFIYDHRQHETLTNMFASLLQQFIV